MKSINNKHPKRSTISLMLGLIAFLLLYIFKIAPASEPASNMAAIAALMAVWWLSEAIPLSATALLPIVLFPLLGINSGETTAAEYFNSTIFLFLGGFLIAVAVENWNLHKRISLKIICFIGGGPAGMILGFMTASTLLSMFISNTATAIMMLPIGLAIIKRMESTNNSENSRSFSTALMLGIAYGASTGGIATLVGTPPNLAFQRIFHITFPLAPQVSFGNWMLMGLPISLIMLILIWLLLTKIFFKIPKTHSIDKNLIVKESKELGKMSHEEKAVSFVFIATALLWIFRMNINLSFCEIPGWSSLLPNSKWLDDGTVAIFMALILFIIPTKNTANSVRLLDLSAFKKIPWEIIILFGGGFALAKGFQDSGLSVILGRQFAVLAGIHPIFMVGIVCTGLTFLTELTSNTATTQTILPILASISIAIKVNPLLLMIPATISASFAFMLPVATPPNAIVFGSGRVSIWDMARTGFLINIIGIIVVTLFFYFIGGWIFGINPSVFPQWAAPGK